ncbi:MAG: T9SS type A sorting domain-containing protein [Ferruginibacter sp.]|nr:T9SS type A sorting domain-containing protein [Cytophagales bacterium]
MLLLLLAASSLAFAQAPTKAWDRTLGGSSRDLLQSMVATPDGGYLLAGRSESGLGGDKTQASKGGSDYWVVKLDGHGNPQWDRTLGGIGYDNLASVVVTADGGYLLAGSADLGISGDKTQAGRGGNDYWIVKLDGQGNKVWDRTLGGDNYDDLASVVATPDGGYLLAGASLSGRGGDKTQASKGVSDYWLVKLDGHGNQEWDRTLGGNRDDRLSAVVVAADGGYLVAGSSVSGRGGDKTQANKGEWDYWIVKLDGQGNQQWDRTLGGTSYDFFGSVVVTNDGGYLLGGSSYSGISDDKTQSSKRFDDYWIVKLDGNGNTQWDQTLGGDQSLSGNGSDNLRSVVATADGGYLLAGSSDSDIGGDKTQAHRGGSDYWIVKVDSSGNRAWDQTLGSDSYETLAAAVVTPDGGYLLAGYSYVGVSGDKTQAGKGDLDYWVVKTSPDGSVKPGTRDVGVAALLTPASACQLTADETLTLRLQNFTANRQTGFNVTVIVDGKTMVEYIGSVALAPFDTLIYALKTPVDLSGEGDHAIIAYTSLPGDQVSSNDTLRQTITHYPRPHVALSGDATICPGTAAQLTASGGVSYQWSTGEHTATIHVRPSETTVYCVTVTNANGCSILDSLTVKVQPASVGVAQAPTKAWDRTLGGSSRDYLESVVATPDGGYLLAGYSASGISGDKTQASRGSFDYWIAKLDGGGHPQWNQTLGGRGDDQLSAAVATPDGGYLLAGTSASGVSGDKSGASKGVTDGWIVKVDDQGNKAWDRTLGGNGGDNFQSVIATPDGGYLLAGYSASGISGDKSEANRGFTDGWIIKVDGKGNRQWDKTLGGNRSDYLSAAVATSDGGYLLAGTSDSGVSGDKSEASRGGNDYWLVKVDGHGNKAWDRTLGGNRGDYLYALVATADGGYLLAGTSNSDLGGEKSQASRGKYDYWIIKVDGDGNLQRDQTLGSDGDEQFRSVVATADGGYLLAGSSDSGIGGEKSGANQGQFDPWLVKLDGCGNPQWDKTLGGNGFDYLESVVATADGGYLLAGAATSGISGDKSEANRGELDYWVIKTTPEGSGAKDVGVTALLTPASACQLTADETLTLRLQNFTANPQTGFAVTAIVDGKTIVENVGPVVLAPFDTLVYTFQTPVDLSREGDHSVTAYTSLPGDQLSDNDTLHQTITHYPPPSISLSGNVTICPGTAAQLTASGGVSYQWSTGERTASIHVRPSETTVYCVTVTNANGCSILDSLTVQVRLARVGVAPAPTKAWDKTLGGSEYDYFTSAVATPDGGYLLGGFSRSAVSGEKTQASKGDFDYWIVKLDGQGNRQWDRTLGGNGGDFLSSAVTTPDGGYLLAGNSDSGISGDKTQASRGGRDYWIVKVDDHGNKEWDRTLGGNGYDDLSSVVTTPDGGYLLAGASFSVMGGEKTQANKGNSDYWVVKLDGHGNPQWDKTLGGDSNEDFSSAITTPDGGYLLTGFSFSGVGGDKTQASQGSVDSWIVKLDCNGNQEWDRTLGGNSTDYLSSAVSTPDGGYLAAGNSNSGISGDKTQASRGGADYWVVKLDGHGNPQWDRTLGGNGSDNLRSVVATADGGYLLAGSSYSGIGGDKTQASKGQSDQWIVKLDGCGNQQWDQALGGNSYDYLESAVAAPDGGYLLAGSSTSGISGEKTQASRGGPDYWVVKTTPDGSGANDFSERAAGTTTSGQRRGTLDADETEMRVYPIPASRYLTVAFTADQEEKLEVVVTDALAKAVLRAVRPVKAGRNQLELSVDTLPNGVYFLTVRSRQGTLTRRIVIAR